MTGLDRTLSFVRGQTVDRPPFHPIIMRWAARYAGVKYRDFCTDPVTKSMAMIRCAKDFDIDWVTVMSDPWAEASAFGIMVEYPEDSLPVVICPTLKLHQKLKNIMHLKISGAWEELKK
jgi:uroporphyrinogen-III decarboxylase